MQRFPFFHVYEPLAVLVIPLLALGCASTPAPKPLAKTDISLSDPKAAALTFLKALKNADPDAAKAASVGTDPQKKWIDGYTALVEGMYRYDQALLARFGARAAQVDAQLKQALLLMGEAPIEGIEGATVREDERTGTAQIQPGLQGVRFASRPPMFVRKTGPKQWKVDLAAEANDPKYDPAVADQYLQIARVMREMADEVKAGRFKSVDDAEAAMDERMSKVTGEPALKAAPRTGAAGG